MFATAGGGGEAYDMCCFCPLFLGILATGFAAFASLKSETARLWGAAVTLTALTGMVAVPLFASMTPTDDPDEVGSHEWRWILFWMWVGTAGLALTAVIARVARAFGAAAEPAAPDARVDEPPPEGAPSASQQDRHGSESINIRLRGAWLLALCLGLLLMVLLIALAK